jgi:hypothetical protein
MTKLTLYKVESRLQKLEEFTLEIVDQLQQLTNQIKLKNSLQYSNKDEFNIEIDDQLANNNNNLYDSKLALNANTSSTYQKSRPYLRRRMTSECHTDENEEVKYFNQSFRVKKKNSFENQNKTIGRSLTKIDQRVDSDFSKNQQPMFTIDDVSDMRRSSLQTESVITDIDNQRTVDSPQMTKESKYQTQHSTCLDQYTLHPFVYLQPVVKPPLNEYTSITDCIDTSEIDRAPSPPPSFLSSSAGAVKKDANLALDVSEYCASESVRSAIARQESEMLRLAEESQHVIITQMLNKMVKVPKGRIKSKGKEAVTDTVTKADDEQVFSIELYDEKAIDVDHSVENEDYLGALDPKNGDKNNNFDKKTKTLLNEKHRNSSQIWYAQSEADVLCLDEDEATNC